MKSGWWPDTDMTVNKWKIEKLDKKFREVASRHPRAFHVDYDSFTQDRALFEGLFDFLGEPFDRTQLDEILDRRLTHVQREAQPAT